MAINGTKKIQMPWKRVIVALCFLMINIINQRYHTGSGLDGIVETFRDLLGVPIAVMIVIHYKWEDFRKYKIPYLIWTSVGILGGILFWNLSGDMIYFANDRITVILEVFLYGYIVIHTFISVVIEKKYPKLNQKYAILWLAMMLLMVVSRSTYIWPLAFLIMFGCFYLTDYTKQEQDDIYQGMLDGIILSFFVFQAYCCMFRPFDPWDNRYKAIFNNSNHAALFYCMVLAVIAAKIMQVYKKKAHWIWKVWYLIFAAAVYSLLFMTIGRLGWIVGFLTGILALMFIVHLTHKKNFIRNGIALLLCTCILFVPVFSIVRYTPALFHHPVWFWGEWDRDRVHAWDPWDSWKYVDLNEFMETALGRISTSVSELFSSSPFAIRAYAAEPNKIPMFAAFPDGFTMRRTIYQYYFEHLNLFGHPYAEQGFQMTATYWIGHAHDIYLQFGTDFGIIAMILFMTLLGWGAVIAIRKFWKDGNTKAAGSLFLLFVPCVFGIFEYCWGVGSLTIPVLFVLTRNVLCDGGMEDVCSSEENNR